MLICDTLIRNANVLDGNGNDAQLLDVALRDGRVAEIGSELHATASRASRPTQ